jgi:hypothetical protein
MWTDSSLAVLGTAGGRCLLFAKLSLDMDRF